MARYCAISATSSSRSGTERSAAAPRFVLFVLLFLLVLFLFLLPRPGAFPEAPLPASELAGQAVASVAEHVHQIRGQERAPVGLLDVPNDPHALGRGTPPGCLDSRLGVGPSPAQLAKGVQQDRALAAQLEGGPVGVPVPGWIDLLEALPGVVGVGLAGGRHAEARRDLEVVQDGPLGSSTQRLVTIELGPGDGSGGPEIKLANRRGQADAPWFDTRAGAVGPGHGCRHAQQRSREQS